MAEVELKSTQITNDDATPPVLTDSIISGGRLIETVGVVATNDDDSDNSEYLMVKVPSNARVSQVLLSHDGSGSSTGDANVGVFNADGSVKDEDLFGSAVDINASDADHQDVTYESGNFDYEDSEKRLWDALGESEDPHVDYIIGLKLTEAVDAVVNIALKVRYVI